MSYDDDSRMNDSNERRDGRNDRRRPLDVSRERLRGSRTRETKPSPKNETPSSVFTERVENDGGHHSRARALVGMSPEVLDGLARAFTRDGYVIVEGVLSPVQLRVLRAECDAVTRRYALLGGHPAPRLRDSSAPSESEAEAEDDADPSNAPLEWLSRDFGCVLEVPGCCGCCPPPDPLTGGYRSSACAVTRLRMASRLMWMAASSRSRTICSTSRPT